MFKPHRMFFAGAWGESPFQKGDLKYVILDLIKDKPRHGYEVIRILEEHSHGFYAPSPGAVYPTLQLLEELGYVIATQQDGKKVYAITEEGRRFLAERENVAEDIKKNIKDWWNPEIHIEFHETMHELGALGRSLGRLSRKTDGEKLRRIRDVILKAKDEIEAILRT
jgi:DNA-binding PadR family transcriptional regulator